LVSHLAPEHLIERSHRSLVQIGECPVEVDPRHPHGIPLGVQGDSGGWIWGLLLSREQLENSLGGGGRRASLTFPLPVAHSDGYVRRDGLEGAPDLSLDRSGAQGGGPVQDS